MGDNAKHEHHRAPLFSMMNEFRPLFSRSIVLGFCKRPGG